jgi:hypothetical protein
VDNIKMDLRKIGWGGMDWIDLSQDITYYVHYSCFASICDVFTDSLVHLASNFDGKWRLYVSPKRQKHCPRHDVRIQEINQREHWTTVIA